MPPLASAFPKLTTRSDSKFQYSSSIFSARVFYARAARNPRNDQKKTM